MSSPSMHRSPCFSASAADSLGNWSNSDSFSISARIPSETPPEICAPSFQYTLYPLYSFGLWLAVMLIPAAHPSFRTAYESSGVGRSDGKR